MTNVNIDSGSIDGVVIGENTAISKLVVGFMPMTGNQIDASNINLTGDVNVGRTLTFGSISGVSFDINGGTIDIKTHHWQ
ncbi:MAG: hypothetical protein Rpha_0939 [Candidatus Ruthia sp. Apha_13_S6]|nr:hypothetical protein [Candidatus Ruthia sp. Apha_13_S6]